MTNVKSSNGACYSFKGTGRQSIGEALVIDFVEDSISCGYCGHSHCASNADLMQHIHKFYSPLISSGPVRGEDYDLGRFSLMMLCCSNCGGLTYVQVVLEGAPRVFSHIRNWNSNGYSE